MINKLRQNIPSDAKPEEIEAEFKEFCKTAKGKDEKFVSFLLLNYEKKLNYQNLVSLQIVLLYRRSPNICHLYYTRDDQTDELEHAG